MKKIILLVMFVFVLSGCTATYEVVIEDESYKESLTINGADIDSNMSKWNIPVYADENDIENLLEVEKVPKVTYYEKTETMESGIRNYKYYNEFNMTEYYRSYFAVNSYDFFGVFYDDTDLKGEKEIITISTSSQFLPFAKYENLDAVTVKIKTNHRVYSHNADSVDKYTYTWNITRDNYEDKAIQIRLLKEKYVLNYNNEVTKGVYIALGVVGVLLILLAVFYFKIVKSNKI